MNIPSKFRPTGSGGLPPGYTRVDFLENTGLQYLNFDFEFCSDIRTTIIYAATAPPSSGDTSSNTYYRRFFGAAAAIGDFSVDGVTYKYHMTTIDQRGRLLSMVYAFGIDSMAESIGAGEKCIVVLSNGEVRHNKTNKKTQTQVFDGSANTTAQLWRWGGGSSGFIGRVYSFRHERTRKMLVNLTPALDATGAPCMFDTVSKQPFRNAGSGQFVVGLTLGQVRRLRLPAPTSLNELTLSLPWQAEFDSQAQSALHAAVANGWLLSIQYEPIPGFDGYVRAAYLKSTGQQWIDTGLTGLTKDSFVEFRGVAQGEAKRAYQMHGFALTGVDSTFRRAFTNIAYPDLTKAQIAYIPLNATIPHKVEVKHYVGTICLNGTEFTETDLVDSVGTEPIKPTILRLFSYYDPSLYTGTRWIGTCEHFRSKMSNGEVYFVPAIDPAGTPCMFDLVSKKPYYDNGTSGVPFIVGLTKEQAETLVLGDKSSGLTIAVPKGTDTVTLQANNPNVTITIQNT